MYVCMNYKMRGSPRLAWPSRCGGVGTDGWLVDWTEDESWRYRPLPLSFQLSGRSGDHQMIHSDAESQYVGLTGNKPRRERKKDIPTPKGETAPRPVTTTRRMASWVRRINKQMDWLGQMVLFNMTMQESRSAERSEKEWDKTNRKKRRSSWWSWWWKKWPERESLHDRVDVGITLYDYTKPLLDIPFCSVS